MATGTTILPVRDILRMVEHGQFRIPDFQRPFIWSPERISSFLESVASGAPPWPPPSWVI